MLEIEWWRAELLNRKEQKKEDFPRITGGSLEWSIFRSVEGTGTITFADVLGFTPDWLTDRIRLYFCKGDPKGDYRQMSFGIWLVSVPEWEYEALGSKDGVLTTYARAEFTLADKTEIFNTPIGRWLTYDKDTPIIPKIFDIIQYFNETAYAITASEGVMRSAKTWSPEDTWLTVINDLLSLLGYGSLYADLEGVLRSEPYVTPDFRPVVGAFGAGITEMRLKKTWRDELPIFELPTGFVIFVPGDDEEEGLIARADLPDEHPLSAQSRGREYLLTETDDAADQEAANLKAQKRLDDSLQITRKVTIDYPIDIERFPKMNDVVMLTMSGFKGPLVQRTVKLEVGANVSGTIRRIYTGGELPWS